MSENPLEGCADERLYVSPIQGLATTNNDLFIRNWYEVDLYRTGFGCDQETAKESQFKWFPVNREDLENGMGIIIVF